MSVCKWGAQIVCFLFDVVPGVFSTTSGQRHLRLALCADGRKIHVLIKSEKYTRRKTSKCLYVIDCESSSTHCNQNSKTGIKWNRSITTHLLIDLPPGTFIQSIIALVQLIKSLLHYWNCHKFPHKPLLVDVVAAVHIHSLTIDRPVVAQFHSSIFPSIVCCANEPDRAFFPMCHRLSLNTRKLLQTTTPSEWRWSSSVSSFIYRSTTSQENSSTNGRDRNY